MATRDIDVRLKLTGADEFKRGMDEAAGSMNWLDVTKGILGSEIIQKGFEMLAQAMGHAIDGSIQLEVSMANLQKTMNLSDTGIANMREQIESMSQRVPKSAEEIAYLAEQAAHLGLSSDQVLPFTEVMIGLGEATDMSAESAISSLGQLANVMQTSGADYERLGSTILELGRTTATTESRIVEMAQNMAGMSHVVGMSEADVLAFAAAMSSVGVETASGGSSISTLITKIETLDKTGSPKLKQFADVAGMSVEAFSQLWRTDPAQALSGFVTGLHEISENGGSVIKTMTDMGLTEKRLTRNLANLAEGSDVLNGSLETARAEWENSTRLAESTAVVYGTTASQIQMAQNRIQNAQNAIGDKYKENRLSMIQLEAQAAEGIAAAFTDDSLDARLKEINGRYDDTASSITGAQTSADYLISALAGMGDASKLDASGLAEYQATMAALMKIAPGVAEMYDEQTGAIEGGTEALSRYVDEMTRQQLAENEAARSSEQLEAYSFKAEQLEDLRAQAALASAELANAEKVWQDFAEEHSGEDMATLVNSDEYKAYDAATRAAGEYNAALAEGEKYVEQYSYILTEADTAVQNLNDSMADMGETTDAEGERMNAVYEAMTQELTAYQEAYEAVLEETEKTVGKMFKSPFGGLGDRSKAGGKGTSVKDLKKSLQEQTDYYEEYATNLQKVKEMGASDELLTALADGSDESFQALQGIVKAGGEGLSEMNALYEQSLAAQQSLASGMADAVTGLTDKCSEIESAVSGMAADCDQSATAQASGSATVGGLVSGMNSQLAALRAKVAEIKRLAAQAASAGGADGSHAAGLSYVPNDNYVALLHRGEMVLTALEAKAYRAEQFANFGMMPQIQQMSAVDRRSIRNSTTNNTFNFGSLTTRSDADVDRLSRELYRLTRRDQRLVGA